MSAETRLATYGTLAPGEVNHHQMAGMEGVWFKGRGRGHLHPEGWGAEHGCPGMTPDEVGDWIEVHIFESSDLPGRWTRLDDFEGAEYRRTIIEAEVDGQSLPVSIYALAKGDDQI